MKKLLAKKKNNKGFSLVELIVVILIMAIIAVALAPQVMKWVGRSSENTDKNNEATIKSAVQVAVAEYISEGNTLAPTTTFYVIKDSGLSETSKTAKDTYTSGTLIDLVAATMGDFPGVQSDSNKVFKIVITYNDTTKTTTVNVTTE